MKLWVGVTDKSWFEQLAALAPDEVNFWQPSWNRSLRRKKTEPSQSWTCIRSKWRAAWARGTESFVVSPDPERRSSWPFAQNTWRAPRANPC